MVVESTLADKPLYLYTYDIDQYGETTGLNMNFDAESIGKYVFRDAESLAKALEEPYDMEGLRAFRKKYIEVDTDNCTVQLADFIESLIPGKKMTGEMPDPEPEQAENEEVPSEPAMPTGLKEE